MPKIIIFIPMYNCQDQITRVLGKINNDITQYINEVVMIDNNSKDNTLEYAIKASQTIGTTVRIFQNNDNYNLGGSIKNALLYAMKNDFDFIIVLHGDDQADVNDLSQVLKTATYNNYDLYIGSRFHPKSKLIGYSRFRTFGNKVFNFFFTIVVKHKVHDMIAGLNIYKVSFFKDKTFLNFPNNLTFDAHLLLYAFYQKARVSFFPISWRDEDQVSNARVFKQAKVILKLLLQFSMSKEKVFKKLPDINEENFKYKIVYEREIHK